jgi:hypothetical protein
MFGIVLFFSMAYTLSMQIPRRFAVSGAVMVVLTAVDIESILCDLECSLLVRRRHSREEFAFYLDGVRPE